MRFELNCADVNMFLVRGSDDPSFFQVLELLQQTHAEVSFDPGIGLILVAYLWIPIWKLQAAGKAYPLPHKLLSVEYQPHLQTHSYLSSFQE